MADEPTPATEPHQAKASGWRHLLDNPWAVLALCFLVMGILGVPLIWASRGFSLTMKLVWTASVTFYTALLFYVAYLAVAWSWGRIHEALSQF